MCIMHFASCLLRICLAKNKILEFLYGILLVLSRCCFLDQYFFQKIKSYGWWSAEKLTVKFYLAPEVRNRKLYLAPGVRNGKIYLAQNDSYEKFYLAVKGLNVMKVIAL